MKYRCGYFVNRCYIKAMRKWQMNTNLYYLMGGVMDILEYVNDMWEYKREFCRYYYKNKPVAEVKIEDIANATGHTPLEVDKAMSMFSLVGLIEKVMVGGSVDGTKTVAYTMNNLTHMSLIDIENKAKKVRDCGITLSSVDYFAVIDNFGINEADRVFAMANLKTTKSENFDEEEIDFEIDPFFEDFYKRYFNEKDVLR